MVVLFDANIAITYLLNREDPFQESVEKIFELLYDSKFEGCISFHSLPEMWYILRKFATEEERRAMLQKLCKKLRVVAAPHDAVVEALGQNNFKDFEDCLQDKCAKAAGADYIITANIKDFKYSEVRALTPDEFIEMLNGANG